MTRRSEGGIPVCNYCGFADTQTGPRNCCRAAQDYDALAARLAEAEWDGDRLAWLVVNGERVFGTLWRGACKADIDAAMQASTVGDGQ